MPTWMPQWLIINIGGLVLIIVLARLIMRANRRKVEELATKLKPEASLRSWQVETELTSSGIRIIRWSGQDFEIRWIGEDLYRKRKRSVMELTRWRTVDRRGTSGVVLLMGAPEGTELPKSQPVEGLLQSLAVKAAFFALDKGLDLAFGEEVGREIDASTLERVEEVEPLLKGYAVFAELPSEAASVIRNGLDKAIEQTIERGPQSLRDVRPWILIWKRGVVVARLGSTTSAAALEPMVKAGLAITRAVRPS